MLGDAVDEELDVLADDGLKDENSTPGEPVILFLSRL